MHCGLQAEAKSCTGEVLMQRIRARSSWFTRDDSPTTLGVLQTRTEDVRDTAGIDAAADSAIVTRQDAFEILV